MLEEQLVYVVGLFELKPVPRSLETLVAPTAGCEPLRREHRPFAETSAA